jgi:hypothetical protein
MNSMKIRIATTVSALMMVACSSSNDDGTVLPDNQSAASSPIPIPVGPSEDLSAGSSQDSGAGEDSDTAPAIGSESVINNENYIAILTQVFEIYSGRAYDERLTNFPYARTESQPCDDNQGSVLHNENETVYADCLINADTVTGSVIGGDTFSEFVVTFEPEGLMRLEGSYSGTCCDPTDALAVSNLSYYFSYPEGTLSVESASTHKDIQSDNGKMGGSFVMEPPVTGGQSIAVNVQVEFDFDYRGNQSAGQSRANWTFDNGMLELRADDGSELTLDAATGDPATVSVTLNNATAGETYTLSWGLWTDVLRWSPDSL